MNVKKSAKKIFAIAAGLALVGTTVMGALAYDLSNYPAPFVENGVANGVIVVGANAATSDVLGAIDIAASLQAAAVTATPIAGTNAVTVEGGKDYDELDLGTSWPSSVERLKEDKLAGFQPETDIRVNGSDVTYYDALRINTNATHIHAAQNEDAAGKEYVVVDSGDVEYRVYFKDSEITQADSTHTATFKMLGQTVEAYGFDFTNGASTFTIVSAKDHAMTEGDTLTVDGHTVTLKRVGSGSVIVDVDGQTKIINDGEFDTFEDAGDFYVSVESLFYVDGATDNVANLKLGADNVETATHDTPAELFNQVDDVDEADWVWTGGTDSTYGRYVGLKLNQDYADLEINTPSEDRAPLFMGDSLSLPNDYAAINFESLAASYKDVTVSLDDSKFLDDGEDAPNNEGTYKVIKFSAADDIFYVGGQTSDTVYAAYNKTSNLLDKIWYVDGSDEIKSSSDTFTIKIDSESITVTPSTNLTASLNTTIAAPSDSDLKFSVYNTGDDAFTYFGTTDDSDTADLVYGTSSLGTKEWDYETTYGIKIANPNNQFSSGSSFVMSIPSEQESATIVVKSKGSVVSAGSDGGMSYTVNPIALGLGVLDTDAPALGSKPMIIVGGPAANTVAADFLGNPTADEIAQTFEQGKALIKYDDAKQAMLVAGWDKQETLGATYVVAKYGNYAFSGNELSVVVTDLNNIEVNPVN